MKKEDGLQMDIFGQSVHILNAEKVYRMVKCGKCGSSVKSSQAKTHISFGRTLTICNECLKKEGKFCKGKKKK